MILLPEGGQSPKRDFKLVDVRILGVQAAVASHGDLPPIGRLVAGIWRERSVLALSARDDSGLHYIILNGEEGRFEFTDESGLTATQVVNGELLIEPADGVIPYALPRAEATGSALVLTRAGDVGLRLTIPNPAAPNQPWVIMNSIESGEPIATGQRILLQGFKLLLKIDGREKPLLIGSY